ncbi:MAG: type I restriction endonuclease subunit R, partial [Caldisericum sp.]|nr:type I restriction endonuclease subunit R [Caldisericum sp.]
MSFALDEEHFVENDFLKRLKNLGFRIYRQDKDFPEKAYEITDFDENNEAVYGGEVQAFRDSFSDVILEKELRSRLKVINPFLTDDQIDTVVRRLKVVEGKSLVEANRVVHTLLTENTSVDENRETHEKSPTVRYIDFKNINNNSFIAISQFKVRIKGTEKHIIPDIVIFVNGIPLVVVECKSPAVTEPIYEAITQLMRYSERRGAKEGNSELFYYNLFQIATTRYQSVIGTITSDYDNFVEWKDAFIPGIGSITREQPDATITGTLSKENLLDLLHTYTLFKETEKGSVKIVARYHQFRAVKKIVEHIRKGSNRKERSGIVWHTQGSGKSLTMMFLVRELYHNDSEFGNFKIVFVTDRRDLERQLNDTSKSVGFTVRVARSIRELKELLKTNTPELVMGMISKFEEQDFEEKFPVLNESPNILVIIDEAHRSQYKELGANLRTALPNATMLAFTGTPIDKTEVFFGDYIDKYTIRESVDDKVTVPIYYEGRVHRANITDKESMNRAFEDVFAAFSNDEKALLMGKYTWRAYLEAEEIINEKAKDMINHYVSKIFPNGFKAQVVTVSREACRRYKKALEKALNEKVEELRQVNPALAEKLSKVRVEAVFSGAQNDPVEYNEFTDVRRQEEIIRSFKLPFDVENEGVKGDVGIIVVQNMLITGFDAPIEQVMYLDNVLKEHNLLQAIARVNRVYKNKSAGYVVDYVGVFKHLEEALANYYEKDRDLITRTINDVETAKNKLVLLSKEVEEFFLNIGIKDFREEVDDVIDILLEDEKRREEFNNLVNNFNRLMDVILPDPFANNYKGDLKILNFIKQSLRSILRTGPSIKEASTKIRSIVEQYVESKGIEVKINEINILDDKFIKKLEALNTPHERARAIEVAIREYIEEHKMEDPELYSKFAEKLEEILKKYYENWELIEQELMKLREEVKEGRKAYENFGLDPQKELPFFGILFKELTDKRNYSELDENEKEAFIKLTKELLNTVSMYTKYVDFWDNPTKQKELRTNLFLKLLTKGNSYFNGVKESELESLNQKIKDKRALVAQEIIETAYHIFGKRRNG